MELHQCISNSKLASKYNKTIDRESAYEILDKKIIQAEKEAQKRPKKNIKNNKTNQLLEEVRHKTLY